MQTTCCRQVFAGSKVGLIRKTLRLTGDFLSLGLAQQVWLGLESKVVGHSLG